MADQPEALRLAQVEPVQEPMQESALQAVAEKIGDQCAVWCGIGARDVEAVLREAARCGLVRAAQAEPTRSQQMADAGFTPRDNRLQCDECGGKFSRQMLPIHNCSQQAEPVQEPFALPCPTPKACREHCCHGACLPAPQQAEPTRSQKLADAGFSRRPGLWALQAREALELIATPQRPDGTWNRDREACRQLAAEALGRYDDE